MTMNSLDQNAPDIRACKCTTTWPHCDTATYCPRPWTSRVFVHIPYWWRRVLRRPFEPIVFDVSSLVDAETRAWSECPCDRKRPLLYSQSFVWPLPFECSFFSSSSSSLLTTTTITTELTHTTAKFNFYIFLAFLMWSKTKIRIFIFIITE